METMESSPEPIKRRSIALSTWPLSAAIAILVSIATSFLMDWRIGSPQLLVITIASLLVAAMFIGVFRSRGRFRLLAILVLMTLVGVGSATVGRQIVFVEKHRAMVRQIAERNGKVMVFGASRQESDGWRMVRGGFVIPSWLHPLYDYFANIRVRRIAIPADLLTIQNLELLPIDGELLEGSVILEGTLRDPDALLELSTSLQHDWVTVIAKQLTEEDVRYLSVLKDRLQLVIESPSLEDMKRLSQIEFTSLGIIKLGSEASGFSTVATLADSDTKERRLTINNSVLSSEVIASFASVWNVQTLEIVNSTLEQGAFDELAKQTKIRYLTINGCKVTDADLLALSQNDRLEYLRLIGTQITDKGLEALSAMKSLVYVDISNSKCTWQGIQKLCRSLKLETLTTDVAKNPSGPSGFLPQPVVYWGKMIREEILEEPQSAETAKDE